VSELEQGTEDSTLLDPVEPDVGNGSSSDLHEVPHFTRPERVARGRAARIELPRSVHANWEPAPRFTPTRTTATARHCATPSRPGSSPPKPASECHAARPLR
jgi:hypothetical protein